MEPYVKRLRIPAISLLLAALVLLPSHVTLNAGDPHGAYYHSERDKPGKIEEERGLLEEADKRSPGAYDVLWRKARLLCWLADDLRLSKDEKSRLGHECWDVAEKAIAARPGGVEGWFFAAGGVGNYSLGLGILAALTKGMEGKFKERLARAQSIDPGFYNGAIDIAWGRLYYELPWPKYDAEKSEKHLRSLQRSPQNVRAEVFLAELFIKEGKSAEARALLERAASHQPGA